MAKSKKETSKTSTGETINKSVLKDLISFHDKTVEASKKISAGDKDNPIFNVVLNCSGGWLLIPDLKGDKDDDGFAMQAGDLRILSTEYETLTINKHRRGLLAAMTKKSKVFPDLPQLLCLESEDTILPFEVKAVKSKAEILRDQHGEGGQLRLKPNMFDVKLRDINAAEIKAEEALRRNSRNQVHSDDVLDEVEMEQ